MNDKSFQKTTNCGGSKGVFEKKNDDMVGTVVNVTYRIESKAED